MTTKKKHLIAVYGSLLTGLGNHRVISRHFDSDDAELLGECETEELFTMLDLSAYPGLVLEPKSNRIHLEVYNVSDYALQSIRMLEGYNPNGTGLYYEYKTNTKFGEVTLYIYNYGDSSDRAIKGDENNLVNWKTHLYEKTQKNNILY